jgi:hypothetical protein
VQAALAHGLDEPGQRGKHATLDSDREQQILDWIQQNAEQDTPVTKTEIMDHCTAEFKIRFTRGWVNSFVLRRSDDFIQTKSAPQEEQHLQPPRVFLERTVKDLHDHIEGCVADLVFNLGEVGISDWEDRKTKKVVLPAAMLSQTIHHGVSRKVKHISVIVCVSAAGASLLPDIVTSQNSPVVQEHLEEQRVCFGRDMILKFNQKPYINAGIFLDYIRTIFLPCIDMLRGLAVFVQEPAVLLMANCSAHASDDQIRILTAASVRVIAFAQHATQIFQVLALTLFSVFKRRPGYELPFDNHDRTVRFIMKVYHDFGQQ